MKKILITGASHGIGKATAKEFIAHGWDVYGCAGNRKDDHGKRMEEEYDNFHFMYADISNEKDVRELFDWCKSPDAAFNNAGIGCCPADVHMMDEAAARRILEVNLFGTALCMKNEAAAMLAGSGGVIINNSSVSALKAATGADFIYSASKAGILRLTAEAAVQKIYRNKIWYYSIIPGWIETRMTADDDKKMWEDMLPSGNRGMPQDAARLVYYIVEHAGCFESGQEFNINQGGVLI